MNLLPGLGPEISFRNKGVCDCAVLRSDRTTQIRRTVLRSKGGERKQTVNGSTTRPWLREMVSIAETDSADGRTTVASTGTVIEFAGACLAQQGCCAPQGIAGNITEANRVAATRG